MDIAFDTTLSLGTLLATGVSFGTAVFAWYRTRSKDLENRLKDGADRMDRHDGRISRLEQTVQSMPASADMHKLELRLMEMSGEIRTLATAMEGTNQIMTRVERIVGRHEDHLLGGKQ